MLHPIEIKKTASPPVDLAEAFRVLENVGLPCDMGAIVYTKQEFSAIDRMTAIVPVWAL
ncbi:MAG: hypothetical protein LBE32_01830 [Burkholderiales bacterium]|nr:hypothetical protein [Burkholderiales bacterium]